MANVSVAHPTLNAFFSSRPSASASASSLPHQETCLERLLKVRAQKLAILRSDRAQPSQQEIFASKPDMYAVQQTPPWRPADEAPKPPSAKQSSRFHQLLRAKLAADSNSKSPANAQPVPAAAGGYAAAAPDLAYLNPAETIVHSTWSRVHTTVMPDQVNMQGRPAPVHPEWQAVKPPQSESRFDSGQSYPISQPNASMGHFPQQQQQNQMTQSSDATQQYQQPSQAPCPALHPSSYPFASPQGFAQARIDRYASHGRSVDHSMPPPISYTPTQPAQYSPGFQVKMEHNEYMHSPAQESWSAPVMPQRPSINATGMSSDWEMSESSGPDATRPYDPMHRVSYSNQSWQRPARPAPDMSSQGRSLSARSSNSSLPTLSPATPRHANIVSSHPLPPPYPIQEPQAMNGPYVPAGRSQPAAAGPTPSPMGSPFMSEAMATYDPAMYTNMNGQISLPNQPLKAMYASSSDMNGGGDASGSAWGSGGGAGGDDHGAGDYGANGGAGDGYGGDYPSGGAGGEGDGSGSGAGGGDGSGGGGDGNGGDGGGGGDDDGNNPGEGGVVPKRRKLALACHFCRRRKLKCDGQRPTCENCFKRREVCSWDDNVRRRGPGKRTKEMRDRAQRDAQAAGVHLDPNTSHLVGELQQQHHDQQQQHVLGQEHDDKPEDHDLSSANIDPSLVSDLAVLSQFAENGVVPSTLGELGEPKKKRQRKTHAGQAVQAGASGLGHDAGLGAMDDQGQAHNHGHEHGLDASIDPSLADAVDQFDVVAAELESGDFGQHHFGADQAQLDAMQIGQMSQLGQIPSLDQMAGALGQISQIPGMEHIGIDATDDYSHHHHHVHSHDHHQIHHDMHGDGLDGLPSNGDTEAALAEVRDSLGQV